jgi:hypothetical protein
LPALASRGVRALERAWSVRSFLGVAASIVLAILAATACAGAGPASASPVVPTAAVHARPHNAACTASWLRFATAAETPVDPDGATAWLKVEGHELSGHSLSWTVDPGEYCGDHYCYDDEPPVIHQGAWLEKWKFIPDPTNPHYNQYAKNVAFARGPNGSYTVTVDDGHECAQLAITLPPGRR